MERLDLESQFILYYIHEQNTPVKRREIEVRYPRMEKSPINYRLDKMRKMGLIQKNEHQEYGHGVNATYEWSAIPSKVEQYENEYSELVIPSWKWHEYADKYFDAFESRLKQLEKQLQDS
jgi:predicted transcriptional regulator